MKLSLKTNVTAATGTVVFIKLNFGEEGGEILSFTRALPVRAKSANPVAKAGSLSPLKLMEY